MKNTVSLLLLLACTCGLYAQSVDYVVIRSGCKTERTYYAEGGNTVVTSFSFVDTSGNMSYISDDCNQTSYFEDSLMVKSVFVKCKSNPLMKEVTTYRYENRRLCEVQAVGFLGERRVSLRLETHTFDTVENKEYVLEYRDQRPESKTVKTYDYDRCLIKSATYIADAGRCGAEDAGLFSLKSSRSYIYDEKSRLIETIDYVYDGEGVSQRIVTLFDGSQNVTKVRIFDVDDFLLSEISYKYDRKGNETRRVTVNYLEDGSKETLTTENKYKYDKQGRMILRENSYNGTPVFSDRCVYL